MALTLGGGVLWLVQLVILSFWGINLVVPELASIWGKVRVCLVLLLTLSVVAETSLLPFL